MTSVEFMPERPPGSRRATRLRTTQIDDELWADATAIAKIRGESMSAVMREAVKRYVARHRNLLEDAEPE